jgi:CheY-like chemotaxis protein
MKTIRSRILLSFCLLLLGFGAIFSTIYYLNLRREIIKGYDERLRSHALNIANLLDVEDHEKLRHPDQMATGDLPVTDKVGSTSCDIRIHLPLGHEQLLVVDDDDGVRALYSDLLSDLGYKVLEAEDGQQAMKQLTADSIQLVVLDVNMPHMDGPQTLREIRLLSPTLPVLIASGMGNFPKEKYAEDPHLRFMPKPFRIENMAQMVRQMLDYS